MSMTLPLHPTLDILGNVALFGFLAWLYIRARRRRPRFEKSDILYQERYASGCSQKNILTRLGGARYCLWLVVTRSVLLVTSWFPFSLFTPFYDLEHVIPLDSIASVRRSSFIGWSSVLLTYRDTKGKGHTLRLYPKQPEDFIRSLGVTIDNETPT
jgi:hypothetical protein